MGSRAKHTNLGSARKYAFRPGARVPKGLSADAAGAALEALYLKHGKLTAPLIIKDAEPPDSPLHPGFTWDDKVAGRKYRLWEARMLARNIEVVTVPASTTQPAVQHPVYVHVPGSTKQREYAALDDVITRPEQYTAALAAAMARRDQMEAFVQYLKRRVESSPLYADRAAALTVVLESLATCKLALGQAAVM